MIIEYVGPFNKEITLGAFGPQKQQNKYSDKQKIHMMSYTKNHGKKQQIYKKKRSGNLILPL